MPPGGVTFLFTDVEGSTKLLLDLGPDDYAATLADHRRVFRAAFVEHDGVEVGTEGDSFFAVFEDAAKAVAAVQEAQRGLTIPVRMGLHTGVALVTEEGYVGIDVHLGARIAACGAGGQVLMSEAVRQLTDAQVEDLGEHRLKDIVRPVRIFQLGTEPFPPLKTISNTNLPHPSSSFVGRETEVADLVGQLGGAARLVTLTGAGGAGKTRLAIEAAAALVPEFRAGVFWIGLAELRESDLVTQAIARVLGAGPDLAAHIGEREMLLVLDNFEQVVEAAPELGLLLSGCPNLRLLVTSRERLRIEGEVAYSVPPLAGDQAVELFCVRAAVEADDTVLELCRRLDSLPLAIELAASLAGVLTPGQMIARLSRRLDLFEGGRDADPRQATLRATIEWSYGLLSDDERALFARLAGFGGGCELEAAEAVSGAELHTLRALVEKSLVRFGDGRFWMLETIREFARERLESSGEAEELARRHAEHYLEVAASAGFAHESRTPERHDLVGAELANFRAALDWSLEADVELGLRLATALEFYWVAISPFEGRRWLEALLARADDVSDELRALGLKCCGGVVWIVGEWDEGRAYYDEALALYRRLGDEAGIAIMLPRLAADLQLRGDLDEARVLCEDALARHLRAGFEKGEAEVMLVLAYIAVREGRFDEAIELSDRSAALAAEVGFLWWQIGCLGNAAEIALMLGRAADARSRARRALTIAHTIGGRQWMVSALGMLAWVAAASCEAEEAGLLWGAIEAETERGPVGQWEAEREEYASRMLAVSGPVFDAAAREGGSLTLDAAVAHVLEAQA